MSITSDRECWTVLRGKLKKSDNSLHQERLGHFLLCRRCWRFTDDISLAKFMHEILIACTNEWLL